MIRQIAVAVLVLLSASSLVQAAEKTVVLQVDNATCALCAPIVKAVLARVAGVKTVQVAEADADSGAVATVTFDDSITNVAALADATAKAGYPARVAP
jgi:periplasmic mercuric ion binding protein